MTPDIETDKGNKEREFLTHVLAQLDGSLSCTVMRTPWMRLPNGLECRISDNAVKDWLTFEAYNTFNHRLTEADLRLFTRLLANIARNFKGPHIVDTEIGLLVRADPLLQALIELMATKTQHTIYISQLYDELNRIADSAKLRKNDRWPKTPNVLSRALKTLELTLPKVGITINAWQRNKHGTRVTLSSIDNATDDGPGDETTESPPDTPPPNFNVDDLLEPNGDEATKNVSLIARLQQRKEIFARSKDDHAD